MKEVREKEGRERLMRWTKGSIDREKREIRRNTTIQWEEKEEETGTYPR